MQLVHLPENKIFCVLFLYLIYGQSTFFLGTNNDENSLSNNMYSFMIPFFSSWKFRNSTLTLLLKFFFTALYFLIKYFYKYSYNCYIFMFNPLVHFQSTFQNADKIFLLEYHFLSWNFPAHKF